MAKSTKTKRLRDSYRFPGFHPALTVVGLFGDPHARVIRLTRRPQAGRQRRCQQHQIGQHRHVARFTKGVTENLPHAPNHVSTSSMSSLTPASPWTRCGAWSKRSIRRSKGCAGRCSRTEVNSPTSRQRTSTGSSQIHHQTHCASVALSRAIARHSRSQADQCRIRHAEAVVHQCPALQGRSHEGRRHHDPRSLRRHYRLDPDPPDQWLHRRHNGLFQAAKR